MMWRALTSVAAILLCAGPVLAQPGGGLRRGPCRADIERLCPDADPRGGGLGTCLRDHRAELSEECAASFERHEGAMRERAASMLAACSSEAAKLCPDAAPGQGGLGRCLRAHETELSETCREALPPRRGPGGGPGRGGGRP